VFNVFIKDGTEHVLNKYAEVERLGRVPPIVVLPFRGTWRGCRKPQRGNLVKFSRGKCHVLPLGSNKLLHPSVLGAERLEGNFAGKNLSVLVDKKLSVRQKSAPVERNTSYISRPRTLVLPLYLIGLLLECCVQFWAS